MKTISEIYEEYKIMPTLREHMLRVAGVASLICDNFTEPLNKEEIISACLLHDMGNIIKFNLEYFPEFNKPEGLEYWQNVQNEYIEKYGEREHEATLKIIRELGIPKKIVTLASEDQFSLLCQHQNSGDMGMKIVHYADARVSPHKVVSYDERMGEAKERYKDHKYSFQGDEHFRLVACGKEIEKQIFAKCKIKPEDINDDTVNPLILKLKDFMIK